MTKYNHMFDIAFAAISEDADACDVTAEMLRDAIVNRVFGLSDEELLDACCLCDTYELDKE